MVMPKIDDLGGEHADWTIEHKPWDALGLDPEHHARLIEDQLDTAN